MCTLIYSQHAKNSHPDISSVTVIDFQVAFFKKGPYDELGGYGNPLSIPIFFVFKRLKAFQWMKCLHNNSSTGKKQHFGQTFPHHQTDKKCP